MFNEYFNGKIKKVGNEFSFTIKTTAVVGVDRYSIGAYGPAGCIFEDPIEAEVEFTTTPEDLFEDYFVDEMCEIQDEHPELKFYDLESDEWLGYSNFTEEQMSLAVDLLFKLAGERLWERIDEFAEKYVKDSRSDPDDYY